MRVVLASITWGPWGDRASLIAPLAIGLSCASIVATALIGVIIGISAYFRALLDAVVAIVVAVFLVRYVSEQAGASRIGDHG